MCETSIWIFNQKGSSTKKDKGGSKLVRAGPTKKLEKPFLYVEILELTLSIVCGKKQSEREEFIGGGREEEGRDA